MLLRLLLRLVWCVPVSLWLAVAGAVVLPLLVPVHWLESAQAAPRGSSEASVVVQSIAVQANPAKLLIRFSGGPPGWQPVLNQSTASAHQSTLKLSWGQAKVPPQVLANKPQWLAALQEPLPGLYFIQVENDAKGVPAALIFKSSVPYAVDLCDVGMSGQVSVCFNSPASTLSTSEGRPTTPIPLPPIPSVSGGSGTAASSTDDSNSGGVLAQAQAAFELAQLSKAKTLLETYFTDHYEPNPQAHLLYAQVLIGLAQPVQALAPLSQIELQHPQAGLLKAHLQLRYQSNDSAAKTLAAVDSRFGPSPSWWYEMGLLAQKEQRLNEAAQWYWQALGAQPQWNEAWYHLAQVFVAQKNWPASLACLNQVLSSRPDDTQALKLRAFVYQNQQRFKEARLAYQQTIQPDLLYNFAVLSKKEGQLVQAKAMALAAYSVVNNVAAGPEQAGLLVNLGLLLADVNEKPTAIQSLERYVRMADNQPDATTPAQVAQAKQALAKLKQPTPKAK
jgi:tetratricopeptide (TPR) repeat protein